MGPTGDASKTANARDKSTLLDQDRDSLAEFSKRLLSFVLEHRLGGRMQLLLYAVAEGHRGSTLEERLDADLGDAERLFRARRERDVYEVIDQLRLGRDQRTAVSRR